MELPIYLTTILQTPCHPEVIKSNAAILLELTFGMPPVNHIHTRWMTENAGKKPGNRLRQFDWSKSTMEIIVSLSVPLIPIQPFLERFMIFPKRACSYYISC